jgi:uncharacterized protein
MLCGAKRILQLYKGKVYVAFLGKAHKQTFLAIRCRFCKKSRGTRMKIVVLSDTHLPKRKNGLPARLIKELKSTDLIIHAGDWQTLDLYKELQTFAIVAGVYGNVDDEEIARLLPAKQVIEVCNFRIGITHGHGKGKTTEKRAIAAFEGEKVDCIIFGHSHIPIMRYEGDILVFNPGSPTDKRRQKLYSFGVISINDKIEAEHIYFNE